MNSPARRGKRFRTSSRPSRSLAAQAVRTAASLARVAVRMRGQRRPPVPTPPGGGLASAMRLNVCRCFLKRLAFKLGATPLTTTAMIDAAVSGAPLRPGSRVIAKGAYRSPDAEPPSLRQRLRSGVGERDEDVDSKEFESPKREALDWNLAAADWNPAAAVSTPMFFSPPPTVSSPTPTFSCRPPTCFSPTPTCLSPPPTCFSPPPTSADWNPVSLVSTPMFFSPPPDASSPPTSFSCRPPMSFSRTPTFFSPTPMSSSRTPFSAD